VEIPVVDTRERKRWIGKGRPKEWSYFCKAKKINGSRGGGGMDPSKLAFHVVDRKFGYVHRDKKNNVRIVVAGGRVMLVRASGCGSKHNG